MILYRAGVARTFSRSAFSWRKSIIGRPLPIGAGASAAGHRVLALGPDIFQPGCIGKTCDKQL